MFSVDDSCFTTIDEKAAHEFSKQKAVQYKLNGFLFARPACKGRRCDYCLVCGSAPR